MAHKPSADYQQLWKDLPVASRILAHHGVVDAFGHCSARNPDDSATFIMSRNLAPASVTETDLVVYNCNDASPVDADAPRGFLERHIHASIYKAFPTINAVVHFHAPAMLPFGLLGQAAAPFKSVYHMASFVGNAPAPIFDISDKFGASTNMLITNQEQGDELATSFKATGQRPATSQEEPRNVVLMRGHGATVIAPDLRAAVFRAVYAVHNAQILLQTMAAAPGQSISFLAEGECASATASNASQADRPWNVWSSQIDYP